MPEDWQDPTVFGRNKLRPHVPLRAFDDATKALHYYTHLTPLPDVETAPPCHAATAAIRSSTRLLDLCALDATHDSPWRFKLFDKPADVPPDFMHNPAPRDWSPVRPKWHAAPSALSAQPITDPCAVQLGVCRFWHAHVHQLPVPMALRPPHRSRGQPHRLLRTHVCASSGMDTATAGAQRTVRAVGEDLIHCLRDGVCMLFGDQWPTMHTTLLKVDHLHHTISPHAASRSC